MAQFDGSEGKLYIMRGDEAVEIGIAAWSFTAEESAEDVHVSPQIKETLASLESQTFTLSAEVDPTAYEPLGVIDHLIWGNTLN
jgi:hypothetical protein